tara:strand:- start:17890 stop:18534 length:645 start_codon:yes stop_codon:yes gene_type:complete
MGNMTDKTDKLIASLSEELVEVKPMPHPLKRILPWLVFATAYISIAVALIGLRHDIIDRFADSTYVFEVLLVIGMSMSAAFCSSWLCTPDIRGQNWIVAIPLSLVAVFATLLLTRASLEHYDFPITHWHLCYIGTAVFGFIPAVTIGYLSKKGKTTHPCLMAMMNIISIGGLGYLALRISCASEDFGHIFVYHVMPYALVGVLITLVASRIYRW